MPNANTKQDQGLISLLAQAENPNIETRDQFKEDQAKPDNPPHSPRLERLHGPRHHLGHVHR